MQRAAAALAVALLASAAAGGELTRRDSRGRTIAIPAPLEEKYKNPAWPADWEDAFQDRANHVLSVVSGMSVPANTYFENEKRSYGLAMLQILAGKPAEGLKVLQAEDAQARDWHRETAGIDWYACFTIKHQVRKYFYFGDLLDPTYRKRMFDGAKLWTERDPLRRPHHAYTGKGVWGPDGKNSWVDVRSTDNLEWMRNAAVYLMAEETGNEETRKIYKGRIASYVTALYRVGMGEWDSENYHGHSIAPVLSLYDFAKDGEVKLLAKACLDWFFAAGAVKYRRGGFNGPSKRDYNHPYPYGGSAAVMLALYFGGSPVPNRDLESDEIHAITGNYRPSPAVVHLARKEFPKPAEIFAAKPHYNATRQGDTASPPADHETQFFGETFQLGSLAFGTQEGDVNGFKVLVDSSTKGVDYILAAPGPDPAYLGSPKYEKGKIHEPNRVAQFRNLAIWLVEKGDAPWLWLFPKSIGVEREGAVTFLRAEKTWIAIHPVNLEVPAADEKLTAAVNFREETDRRTKEAKRIPLWPDHQVLSARGKGGTYSGFALEIGEAASHGGYAGFKAKTFSAAKFDASGLPEGLVEFSGAAGGKVKMRFGRKLEDFQVWRDGKLHDWKAHRFLYRNAEGSDPIIRQEWNGDGTLRVEAGGRSFACTVTPEGKVTFESR